MENRIWKSVKGFEGIYEVSNFGKVKSLKREFKYGKKEEIILKDADDGLGYRQVQLSKLSKVKPCKVHRLVAIAFIPNPKNKKYVNHINSIRSDNRVENLEWNTHLENMQHCFKTGGNLNRSFKGEDHPMSKLTNKEVIIILKIYKTGKLSQKEIAEIFNCSRTTITAIMTGQNWGFMSK